VVLLIQLTCKNVPWYQSKECQRSFDLLKLAFMLALILIHWDPSVPLIVETDVLDCAIAAILSTLVKGEVHSIVYHFQTLSATELNYIIHNKELLVIFDTFKK